MHFFYLGSIIGNITNNSNGNLPLEDINEWNKFYLLGKISINCINCFGNIIIVQIFFSVLFQSQDVLKSIFSNS